MKDIDTGFIYEDIIIRENESMEQVLTAETIDKYLNDFKANKIQVYLRTESRDQTPVVKDGILQVYGSNFKTLVKDRRYAPADEQKGLLLFFSKADCPKCEWNEAYFERLAQDDNFKDFVFAKMDIDKNYPTSDYRDFLYNTNEEQPMLQFLAVLPDGGTLNRFQKDNESYDDLVTFLESTKYLLNLQKTPKAAVIEEL